MPASYWAATRRRMGSGPRAPTRSRSRPVARSAGSAVGAGVVAHASGLEASSESRGRLGDRRRRRRSSSWAARSTSRIRVRIHVLSRPRAVSAPTPRARRRARGARRRRDEQLTELVLRQLEVGDAGSGVVVGERRAPGRRSGEEEDRDDNGAAIHARRTYRSASGISSRRNVTRNVAGSFRPALGDRDDELALVLLDDRVAGEPLEAHRLAQLELDRRQRRA